MNPAPFENFEIDLDRMFASQVWFAWRPVRMRDGRWAWMRRLLRRTGGYGWVAFLPSVVRFYDYRPIPPNFEGLEEDTPGYYRTASRLPRPPMEPFERAILPPDGEGR